MARFMLEIVEQLDLSALVGAYAGSGSKAYHPVMRTCVAVAHGFQSNRLLPDPPCKPLPASAGFSTSCRMLPG
jgi:hypothetical protein